MTSLTTSESKSDTGVINPWLMLLVAILAATFAAPFMKLSQNSGMPSAIVAMGRMGLAALFLTPVVISHYRDELSQLTRRDLIMALVGGLFLALHFMLIVFALETTTVLLLMVAINTGPLWVAMIERFFLDEHINRWVWIGLLITIVGSVYIALNSGATSDNLVDTPLLGAGLALIGAIAGAGYITVGRSVRQKVSLFPYVWIVFGVGGLLSLAFVGVTGTPILGHPFEGYGWLLLLALIPQLVGHSGFNYVLGYISATITSLSSQMVTITATIAAFFIFSEIPQSFEIVGSIIIACGVLLALVARTDSST